MAEHNRVIRLATALTGSPQAAEDLSQEVFLEAWKNRHKLVEPEGASRWISAITRNICLRWLRSQGRSVPIKATDASLENPLDCVAGETPDFEIELERNELVRLLDRAMASLPEDTRAALILRYIAETPQAEIANRLGLTEGAVEARLQRGKLSLRRLLVSDYRAEAAAFGLIGSDAAGWMQTRLWCPHCGQHHLYGTLPYISGQFELHCPQCSWHPNTFFAQSNAINDFKNIRGFRATLKRFETYMLRLFEPRLSSQVLICQRCGGPVPIQLELPPAIYNLVNMGRQGVYILCPACHASSYADIYGLAMNTPLGQRFWQENPRMRTLPAKPIDFGGQSAWLIRLESLANSQAQDIILSEKNYAPMNISNPLTGNTQEKP